MRPTTMCCEVFSAPCLLNALVIHFLNTAYEIKINIQAFFTVNSIIYNIADDAWVCYTHATTNTVMIYHIANRIARCATGVIAIGHTHRSHHIIPHCTNIDQTEQIL